MAGTSLSSTTYLGGSGPDLVKAMAFDAAKNIYVVSATGSENFPGLTRGAFAGFLYKSSMQCVVTKLDPTATHVINSTVLPAPGVTSSIYFDGVRTSDVAWSDRDCNPTAIRVDASGNIYVAGSTSLLHIEGDGNHAAANLSGTMMGFVTKLDTRRNLAYSTVIGAYTHSAADGKNHYTGEKSKTFVTSLALDASGKAYVGGWTDSHTLPGIAGAMQATIHSNIVAGFVTVIDTDGTAIASTYSGGSPFDTKPLPVTTHVNEIVLDSAGNLIAVGNTNSNELQISPDAVGKTAEHATSGFVQVLSTDLKKLVYGSFIHPGLDPACLANLPDPLTTRFVAVTDATGVSLDATGRIYVTGTTSSPCLSVTGNAVQKYARSGSAGYLLRLDVGKALDCATYLDLGDDVAGSMKVLTDPTLSSGGDASLYIVHSAVGAEPTVWPTYSVPAGQLRNLKTANVFLEHLAIAPDGSSSAVDSVTGLGGTYSTALMGVAIAADGKSLGIAGTTKTGDLPTSAGAVSALRDGASDGVVALFSLP
ncbi:MAG: hypothetical protein ABJB01_11410 [Rudaea sp.]